MTSSLNAVFPPKASVNWPISSLKILSQSNGEEANQNINSYSLLGIGRKTASLITYTIMPTTHIAIPRCSKVLQDDKIVRGDVVNMIHFLASHFDSPKSRVEERRGYLVPSYKIHNQQYLTPVSLRKVSVARLNNT